MSLLLNKLRAILAANSVASLPVQIFTFLKKIHATLIPKRRRLAVALCSSSLAVAYQTKSVGYAVSSDKDNFNVNVVNFSGSGEAGNQYRETDVQAVIGQVLAVNQLGILAQSGQSGQATVFLSNCYVRFSLIPWVDGMYKLADEQAFARAQMEKQYGLMNDWVLQIDNGGGWGSPRLVCAVQENLLTGLQHGFNHHGFSCPRITPYFVACWNFWSSKWITKPEALFALLSDGVLVMAPVKSGVLCGVRRAGVIQKRLALDEIVVFMKRELIFQNMTKETTLFLHAPELEDDSFELSEEIIYLSHESNQPWMASMASALR